VVVVVVVVVMVVVTAVIAVLTIIYLKPMTFLWYVMMHLFRFHK
jgi:hypothetical protein